MAASVAIDTGGTFTDCVWIERGRLRILKVFSTPADPSQAIAAVLKNGVTGIEHYQVSHRVNVSSNDDEALVRKVND